MHGLGMGHPPGGDRTKGAAMKTYLRLLRQLRPHWHWMALTLLLAGLTAFTSVLPYQVIGVALNRLVRVPNVPEAQMDAPAKTPVTDEAVTAPIARRRSMIPIAPVLEQTVDWTARQWPQLDPVLAAFLTYGVAFFFLFVFSEIIHVCQGLCMAFVGQSVVFRFRNKAYTHLQRLSLQYFEDRQTGDIMSRVVNDVGSLEAIIVGPVVELLTDMSRLIFLLYFCLRWDWALTLLALGVTPLLFGVTWAFGRVLRKNFRMLRQKIGGLNGWL